MAQFPQPFCTACGSPIREEWPFCVKCGSRINREPPPIPVCGNCGSTVETSGAFCWKCGVPLATGTDPLIPASGDTVGPPGPRYDSLRVDSTASQRASGPAPSTDPSRAAGPSAAAYEVAGRLRGPLRGHRAAYAIGFCIGVVAILLLSTFLPIGAALSRLDQNPAASAGGFGVAVISHLTVDISYKNASNEWLGSPTQNMCLTNNCPISLNTTSTGFFGSLIVYFFSISSTFRTFNVTSASAPFSVGSPVPCLSIFPGSVECLVLLQTVPPPGTYSLVLSVSA